MSIKYSFFVLVIAGFSLTSCGAFRTQGSDCGLANNQEISKENIDLASTEVVIKKYY